MTANYLLKKFIEYGEKMRNAQQGFFKERDPVKKKEFLIASKKAEQEFDNLLFNAKQLTKDDAVND